MSVKRKYTDEDRARVFVALTVNGGNVKRSARETNIPISTVRLWKTDWEREGGPNEEIMVAAERQAERFVEDTSRVRDKLLTKIEELVDSGDIKAKDAITGFGVLTDKINMAKGLTKQTESRPAIEPAAMRELARGLVEGAISAARQREGEILGEAWEDIEVNTQETGEQAKALPATTGGN